ncbi:acyl carrier protein [Campylobacter jejuni]|uniref:acyl carrier protein n=1 Tax=Campylobacter jejuni TaxID=197 RepID=UPI000F8106D0|nr:acyl carrier protein [Campylobacter jejuni]RTJ85698.1 acyl carrier protein [Campylobacter jejuni]RTJ93123.1 acyl carrier protein [Campylobacter jejuni]
MTKQEFLEKLADALQLDYTPKAEQKLEDIEEYDSLGLLSVSSLYSELFNLEIEGIVLKSCKSVQDLINLAKDHIKD